MKFSKKKIAVEWIILVGCVLFSFLLPPILFYFFGVNNETLSKMYGELLDAIFNGDSGAYLFVLLPYILVQFIRSIVWAIKIIRIKKINI